VGLWSSNDSLTACSWKRGLSAVIRACNAAVMECATFQRERLMAAIVGNCVIFALVFAEQNFFAIEFDVHLAILFKF
jgi:hypothetical protein